jgi:hypothetical protein
MTCVTRTRTYSGLPELLVSNNTKKMIQRVCTCVLCIGGCNYR